MRAWVGGRPSGSDSGSRPALSRLRVVPFAGLLAWPEAAVAADGIGPGDHLATILGGFAFVGALILVLFRIRRPRRHRGDNGVVDAIDDIIDGADDGGSGDGGDGGGD